MTTPIWISPSELTEAAKSIFTPAYNATHQERTLSCPTCRREFCVVRTLSYVPIEVVCVGCEREGRR